MEDENQARLVHEEKCMGKTKDKIRIRTQHKIEIKTQLMILK